jgi:hypothetical protein
VLTDSKKSKTVVSIRGPLLCSDGPLSSLSRIDVSDGRSIQSTGRRISSRRRCNGTGRQRRSARRLARIGGRRHCLNAQRQQSRRVAARRTMARQPRRPLHHDGQSETIYSTSTDAVQLDTSVPGTHSIDYVVTDAGRAHEHLHPRGGHCDARQRQSPPNSALRAPLLNQNP